MAVGLLASRTMLPAGLSRGSKTLHFSAFFNELGQNIEEGIA
jgi:hypothetical protein